MVITDIATLPIRAGVRAAARLVGAAETAVNLTRHVVESLLPSSPREEPAAPGPRREPERPAPRQRAPMPRREPEPAVDLTPDAPEPVHVSEEPVVVAEVADEGAQDGAGAEVTVAEPWEGYKAMKANEVIARLDGASREELAVVQLYEGMGRRRKSVLAQVERRLKAASGPAARRG
ncbi:MAG: hypothetical protein QOG63_1054 [Thermoleophilaceae bacterium]|nr:hypothetical protein [Thermoleophilaceae bacterium]